MLRKFLILALLAASSVVILPPTATARENVNKNNSIAGFSTAELTLQQGRGKGNRNWNRSKRRNGNWYGYKNYGQYRRTQVGNRRYRYVRRPYYRDGRLLYRLVRIFY